MVCEDGRRSGCVAFPIVGGWIDHDALHRGSTVSSGPFGGIAAVAIRNGHATAVGVEKDLGGIEAHAVRRVPRPFDAIAVDLACRHARDEHVPVVARAICGGIDADRAGGLRVIDMVEKQQLDPGGMLREHAEVHPVAARRRPQGRTGSQWAVGQGGMDRAPRIVHQGTGHGFTSQISAAYSAMVRSLENLPELATFKMTLRAHPHGSAYSSSSRRSASR